MDRRLRAPAAERNREPILRVLERVLPEQGRVLELASGSGQHVVHFAAALPGLEWQPSDVEPTALESIAAWVRSEGTRNVRDPLRIDVLDEPWPVATVQAIVCSNLVHISPWEVCEALLRGAARHLAPGGVLVLYGPYKIEGRHTAPSNAAFDADLRARNPAWGVRDLEAVAKAAARDGLQPEERVPMPANNQILVFRRNQDGGPGSDLG